jgi:hypothetical protein
MTMPLISKLFADDKKLNLCLIDDKSHIVLGATGSHVSKIQTALFLVDNVSVDPDELRTATYGHSTAAAVLSYKRNRNIINYSYQSSADNIVGKMTISSLDRDVLFAENTQIELPRHDTRQAFV